MMNLFDEFYDLTERFRHPYGKNHVDHPYTMEMVKECLDNLAGELGSKINKNCRIYRGGRQLGPFEAKAFVIILSRYPSLESINWDEVTDGEPFLIFVNYAALLSNDLSETSRKFIGDFSTQFEPEGISIEHHLIIGKYEETPFGVHIDDATDRVFHFNLGPCAKEMILWSSEEYLATYNGDLARPLDSVSEQESVTYPMEVGGCFFLPADYYHVGRSPQGVSVVISLALTRQNYRLQMNSALNMLGLFAPVKESAKDYRRNFESRPDPDMFPKVWNVASTIGFEKLLEHARTRNRSNNYFIEVFPIDTSSPPTELTVFKITDKSNVQLIENEGLLHVYSRGHHASLSEPQHIETFKAAVQMGTFDFNMSLFKDAMKRGDKGTVLLGWLIATKGAACL
ncbi:hypothetical protein [Xenorhabdus anantnagensis]|uniref:JmjC domain-containing protein n=1 Tax=Xenorhabdus anantnagensis TaxID=3025875 RepID=A0ABT5LVQ8_9GAMM|nr:hypothetical protein [Xenorhabdus anantnagensis]MDC9597095.1 hypothetical protein [Xenorhabdus anantnagensis]